MSLLVGKQMGQAPENCQMISLTEKGLAILPVRYAVVPSTCTTSLPSGLSGKGVEDVPLRHHHYVARSLREGYVYLYYEGHPDKIEWEAYRSNEDGTLAYLNHKALHLSGVTSISELNHCIIIDNASQQKTVWFAFSEHPWSEETFEAMQSDGELRAKRMQDFEPAQWINTPEHDHAMLMTEANIKQVFEYSENISDFERLAEDEDEDHISDRNQPPRSLRGEYYPEQLKANRSRYLLHMQGHKAASTVKNSGAKAGKTQQQPAIFACWDHLGVAHELNGFMLDVAGWVAQYQQEWEREIHTLQATEGLEQAFKDKVVTEITASDRRKTESLRRMEKIDERNRMTFGGQRHTLAQIDTRMAEIDKKYDDYFDSDQYKRRHQAHANSVSKKAGDRWATHYLTRIDTARLATFKGYYYGLLDEAEQLTQQRTQDLQAWLNSSLLIDALSEYHQDSISDGLAFESAVGNSIDGISACEAGQLQLDQWANETAVSDSNLLWRAMASNQTKGIASLDSILAEAQAKKETPLSPLTLNGLGSVIGHMTNLMDINIQSMGIVAAMNEPGTVRFATGGLEKIYNTVGTRIFKPFMTQKVDSVGRFLLEGVMAARANIDFRLLLRQEFMDVAEDVLDYLEDWVEDSSLRYIRQLEKPLDRFGDIAEAMGKDAEKKRRIKVKHLMREGRMYQDKWDALVKQTDSSTINPVVEARFGLLFGFVQLVGIGFMHNSLRKQPEDQRIKAELRIAYLTLGATIAETTSKYVEGVNSASNKLIPLKVAGGALMAVAGAYETYLDVSDARKFYAEGKTALMVAYGIKALASLGVTGLSIMSVAGATSSTVKALAARRGATGLAANVARFAAGRLIMAVTLWVGIGALVLEQIILAIMDDDLQNWLEKSPFGIADKNGKLNEVPFINFEQQKTELDKAVAAVMSQ